MKTVLIIGGGPAGLTAAYELGKTGKFHVVVLEKEKQLGGISRTLMYQGNRIDIGGHRFFSKSRVVMDWWKNMLPLQGAPSCDDIALKRRVALTGDGETPDPEKEEEVMLVRSRLSRIYFLRKFFAYPISLSVETIRNLGMMRVFKMGCSYLYSVFHKREEKTLEDFFVNRFGEELYKTFFRDYTAKVWGGPCREIGADWGSQRVKGVSVAKVLGHACQKLFFWKKLKGTKTETSLIEEFWYPKLGPGQLWEKVGREASQLGVSIQLHQEVAKILLKGDRVAGVEVLSLDAQTYRTIYADYVISTMPVKELIAKMDIPVPEPVQHVAAGLVYRDFMTAGLLLHKLKIKSKYMNTSVGEDGVVFDNWIYIQEPDVKVGRLQIFNNWSPYLVHNRNFVWIGLEYFVNEGDDLWKMEDKDFCQFAIEELEKIGVIDQKDVIDQTVFRINKAYPAYFGTYPQFQKIREYLDGFSNLYLIGRNGMHRYNNMDHSMLSAMEAVKNIISGRMDKSNIWNVNTEKEYHESK